MRGSLHAHILCWFERRKTLPGYAPLGVVPRHTLGTDNRQRPQSQQVVDLANYQEDNLYHAAHVGRIQTEMARPFVGGVVDKRHYGGWDHERLRIAGLARATAHGTIDAPPLSVPTTARPLDCKEAGGRDRIQTKMALHCCTTRYCLQSRSTCRFFFPTGGGATWQPSDNMNALATSRLHIPSVVCQMFNLNWWPKQPHQQCRDG